MSGNVSGPNSSQIPSYGGAASPHSSPLVELFTLLDASGIDDEGYLCAKNTQQLHEKLRQVARTNPQIAGFVEELINKRTILEEFFYKLSESDPKMFIEVIKNTNLAHTLLTQDPTSKDFVLSMLTKSVQTALKSNDSDFLANVLFACQKLGCMVSICQRDLQGLPNVAQILFMSEGILAIDPARHGLSSPEVLQIATFVEKQLRTHSEQNVVRFIRKDHNLPREILIDFATKNVVILSKTGGRALARGHVKQPSDAIGITASKVSVTTEPLIRLVNKKTAEEKQSPRAVLREIPPRELELMKRFGADIVLVCAYDRQKLVDGQPVTEHKTSIIERPYDEDLDAYTEEKRMATDTIASTFLPVAFTVLRMHTEDFIHHDIKPANILRSTSGQAKLTDFGISYKIGDPTFEKKTPSHSYGSFQYTAPEVVNSDLRPRDPTAYGKGTDMYALGCVLYEVLHAGPVPWVGELGDFCNKNCTKEDLHAAQKRGHEEALKEAQSKTSPEKELLLLACDAIHPDPVQRITIEDFFIRLFSIEPKAADTILKNFITKNPKEATALLQKLVSKQPAKMAQLLVETDLIHAISDRAPIFSALLENNAFSAKLDELLPD